MKPSAMRIAIDARLNGYREGGISEYTRHLIDALAQQDTQNEYLILHAARPRTGSPSLTPTPRFHHATVFTPPHHRLERLALSVEVARFQPDLLHSPDFIPPRFGAKRRVITVHDLNFLHFPQFQTPDSLRYYEGHIRAAVHEADHILAVSQSGADDLVNLLSVPREKIAVQVEGADSSFRPLSAEAVEPVRQRLKLPQTYLLFVGTYEPRKNLVGLLEAYHRLRQRLADAPVLVLAGRRGWLHEPIFQKATELRLAEHLCWLENVAPVDLPAVYNGALALVLPSFYEGFGLPALEAMACGIPTVVSNRGSLPEVVGEVGLQIDPERLDSLVEALYRIVTESDLRRQSAAAGLVRATQFSWERAAETVLSVYRKVLS